MEIQYYQHTCKCGCGGKIEIRKTHKYDGIPQYIIGHSFVGKKHSEEAKEIIRKKAKGRKYSEERNKKISENSKGRIVTEETRQKIRLANTGKKRTEEQNNKNSERVSGENHPMFGKHHSEETRQEMRNKALGRKQTEEAKQKIREKAIGKKHTEEENRRNSERNKGEKNAMYGIRRYGEESPNWNGGSSFEPYSPEFNKSFKHFILDRDNYKCQYPNCINICNLHVHHIDYNKSNTNKDNFVTLCNSHHSKTIGKNNREYWIEFYQNIMINRIIDCLL